MGEALSDGLLMMCLLGEWEVGLSSVKEGAALTKHEASDDIGRGKSTFMVELSETSDILRTLTPRTLVILDE